jgi:hypothetical protein
MKIDAYWDFLRFCLDDNCTLPASLNDIDWMQMMVWAKQQAIVGIIYEGIQRAGKGLSMPFDTLVEWVGYAQQIEMQNRLIDARCVEVTEELRRNGLDCMILKGQGNGIMYPTPSRRTPGDIDVLVKDINRQKLTKYVKTRKNVLGLHYEHIEYEENGIIIEIHFIPGVMNNLVYNRRLQQWYRAHTVCKIVALSDAVGSIPVPTWEFNVVFQLAHMMHHFFDEGIGLRQMMDYYFLIKSEKLKVNNGRDDLDEMLRYLGLRKFAGAVMYVLQTVFGLEDRYLIVPADEWRGRTLLAEIMHGGNFGQHSGLGQHSAGAKYLLKIRRNMHFVRQYPAEALCEPVFRTWHFFWRIWNR